jgi:hypothetical protein
MVNLSKVYVFQFPILYFTSWIYHLTNIGQNVISHLSILKLFVYINVNV